jgi:hypothetical protein
VIAAIPHRFADCIKEGAARILHQMPAIADLDRIRQRLVAASP